MQKKRTASLPIFNRGKRPRQALLTHPNNVSGAALEEQQRRDGHWNSQCYGGQAQHRDDQPRYSTYTNSQPNKSVTNSYMPLSTSTPMMSGRAAGYNRSKENMHTATSFRPFHGHTNTQHTQVPGVNKHRGRGVTPHNTTNTGPPNMPNPSSNQMIAPNAARSFSPVNMGPSSAPGKAIEPSKHHGAKLEPSPPPRVSVQLLSHFPRVLTATAKGMEHWSKYKAQTPMLFEIFGTLNSAVMAGPLNSREFSLQSQDGALRCLYWEIDQPLPHIVRGKLLRVVGSWEDSRQWVKCHCVREASQEEAEYAHQLVAVSDSAMREAVARLPEM